MTLTLTPLKIPFGTVDPKNKQPWAEWLASLGAGVKSGWGKSSANAVASGPVCDFLKCLGTWPISAYIGHKVHVGEIEDEFH